MKRRDWFTPGVLWLALAFYLLAGCATTDEALRQCLADRPANVKWETQLEYCQ